MENEVVIHVKIRDDQTRRGLSDIEREAKRVGKSSGDSLSTGLSGSLMRTFSKLGDGLTDALGSASEKLPGILGSTVSALPPQGQAIALVLVAGLAVALAPMLAAAISSAVLLAMGGGVLVAGIVAAAQDPKVKSAFGEFGKTAKDAFKDFGEPFRAPLIRAAGTFTKLIKDIGPQVKELGTIIAPVIDMLAPALAQFLKNAMPGIKDAVKASVPLFKALADMAPVIGDALSSFFKSIAKSGPSATLFFKDLLYVLASLIVFIGDVIGWLASMYANIRSGSIAAAKFIGRIPDAISDAIDWVRRMVDHIRAFPGAVRSAASSAGDAIASAFRNAADSAWNSVRTMASRITNAIRNLPKTLGSGLFHGLGFAHGGVVGAAGGGPRSNMTLVGENGPELVDLAPGSTVHSNADSSRMLAAGGHSGGEVRVVFDFTGADQEFMKLIKKSVRVYGGGNVQTAFGRS